MVYPQVREEGRQCTPWVGGRTAAYTVGRRKEVPRWYIPLLYIGEPLVYPGT